MLTDLGKFITGKGACGAVRGKGVEPLLDLGLGEVSRVDQPTQLLLGELAAKLSRQRRMSIPAGGITKSSRPSYPL